MGDGILNDDQILFGIIEEEKRSVVIYGYI